MEQDVEFTNIILFELQPIKSTILGTLKTYRDNLPNKEIWICNENPSLFLSFDYENNYKTLFQSNKYLQSLDLYREGKIVIIRRGLSSNSGLARLITDLSEINPETDLYLSNLWDGKFYYEITDINLDKKEIPPLEINTFFEGLGNMYIDYTQRVSMTKDENYNLEYHIIMCLEDPYKCKNNV